MKSWGILGDPTPEQILVWKNMPHGEFKDMVANLKKKSKGRSLKRHAVEVKNIVEHIQSCIVYVDAFDFEHAIEQAKNVEKSNLEWSAPKKENPKISYRVTKVW